MVRKKPDNKKPIASYQHQSEQRANNPPVGLVTAKTDPDLGKQKTYAHDPHLDPQLIWAGKAEQSAFAVPTCSLHVHERIDPRTLIEAVKKRNGAGGVQQSMFFNKPAENPSLREAIAFYQHAHGWSNRLIAGDSLLVMNSLLEKEGLGGKVQTIYIDPPYGIKYGSNFQPFVNQRDVKDGKDEDLTAEPEQIRAFRDTWQLGIHSYLTYLRDRLLLARALLTDSGSVFVQIGDENIHRVRLIMDEVFGAANFVSMVAYKTTSGMSQKSAPRKICDYLIWYAKNSDKIKFNRLYLKNEIDTRMFRMVEDTKGDRRPMTTEEKEEPEKLGNTLRPFRTLPLHSRSEGDKTPREFGGQKWTIPAGSWRYSLEGFNRLAEMGRIVKEKTVISTIRFFDDFPYKEIPAYWDDTGPEIDKIYVVQTSTKAIQRCILMTTDPGDLVFDPTCGSGTTAYVAERWGRRWISCDTSRVALTLARQRLMTASFDYYELTHPDEGVGSGFNYKSVPHVTLKSIANNPDIKKGMTRAQIDAAIARHAAQETLYDQPLIDTKKQRVSGPFTVEALPAPVVMSVDDVLSAASEADETAISHHAQSLGRSGETLRQSEWREALARAGIRGKAGQRIHLARLEPLAGCRYLHADGETRPNDEGADSVKEGGAAYCPQRIVISFGPQHAPLEQRQVEHAWEEARMLAPPPALLVFAAFQFDPQAARDIDALSPEKTGLQFLKVQMNADLLTDDLKKKQASNEAFWLIGQPDVALEHIEENHGKDPKKDQWRVSVRGFDYYNTKTGGIESGGAQQIAVWLLDTDYDGRSLYPRQVFFPQAGEKDGWARLAKDLKAEIDPDLIAAYRGAVSLPFAAGEHRRIAVKIVDDRGIESLRVLEIK